MKKSFNYSPLRAVLQTTSASLLACTLFVSAALAAPAASDRVTCENPNGAKNTPITYFQVPMQKRWEVNQKLVERTPYAKYFSKDLVAPREMVNLLESGPLPKKYVFEPSVEGLKKVMATFSEVPVSGYGLVENGPLAYAQSRHVFPGVTAKMFEWWFTWHPVQSERYMLWFPQAHIHNSVEDPARLKNDQLSYAERLYNNPNHIIEYIGNVYLDGYISFDKPESFGIDSATLKKHGFTFNASGIISPATARNAPLVQMIHLGRDTAQGFEIVNRYWIGTHKSFDRFAKFPNGAKLSNDVVKQMGLDAKGLEDFAHEMAVHDMTEFTCLGAILPALYKEYGPKQ